MPPLDVFSTYGDTFAAVIHFGLDRLLPHSRTLAIIMLTLAVMLLTKGMMFRQGHLMGPGFLLAVTAGFYLLLLNNLQPIGEGIMESAVSYGLIGGGSSMNVNTFLKSPDAIFAAGQARSIELFALADSACAPSMLGGCLGQFGSWFPVYAAAWVVFGTFALIALQLMWTCVLLKLSLLIAAIMLAFAMFPPTAQFGFMPIRAVVHYGIQLFVLTLVTAVNLLVITKLTVGTDPGVASVTPILIGMIVFLATVFSAKHLAESHVSGAMLNVGGFLAPLAIGMAYGRSAAGHLDAPATKALSVAGRGTAVGAGFAARGAAAGVRAGVVRMNLGSRRSNP